MNALSRLAISAALLAPVGAQAQDYSPEQIQEINAELQDRINGLTVDNYIITNHLNNIVITELEIIRALDNSNYEEAIALLESFRLLVRNIYAAGVLSREQHDILMTASSTLYMVLRPLALEVPGLRAEFDAMGDLIREIQTLPIARSQTADQIQEGASTVRQAMSSESSPSDACATIRLDLDGTRAALEYTLDQTTEDISLAGQVASLQNAQSLIEDLSIYNEAWIACIAAQPSEGVSGIQLIRSTVDNFDRNLYSWDIAFIEDCMDGSIAIDALTTEERLLYNTTASIIEHGRNLATAYFDEGSISLEEFLSSNSYQIFSAITYVLITDPENPLLRLLLL